jgi:hypothetical protein
MSGYDDSFQTCYFYNAPGEPDTCRWNVYVYQDDFRWEGYPPTNWEESIADTQPPYELAYGESNWAITFDGFLDDAMRDTTKSAFDQALGREPLAINPVEFVTTCGWTPSGHD